MPSSRLHFGQFASPPLSTCQPRIMHCNLINTNRNTNIKTNMVVYKNPKCIFRNTKMVCRNTNPDRYKYKRCVFYSVDKGFSERVRLISVVNCWQVCLYNFKWRSLVLRERFCWVARSRWKVLMRDDGWETPCLKLRFIPRPYFHRHRHKNKWKYKYK